MVVKIPHCVISRNIQQSTHHRDCKTKPFFMQPCRNAHLCGHKKDRAQRMQASIHDGESCETLSCNSYHAKICHGRVSCFLVLKTHWSIVLIRDPDCWQARNLQMYLQTLNDHGGKDSALRAQGKYSASSHHRDCIRRHSAFQLSEKLCGEWLGFLIRLFRLCYLYRNTWQISVVLGNRVPPNLWFLPF